MSRTDPKVDQQDKIYRESHNNVHNQKLGADNTTNNLEVLVVSKESIRTVGREDHYIHSKTIKKSSILQGSMHVHTRCWVYSPNSFADYLTFKIILCD